MKSLASTLCILAASAMSQIAVADDNFHAYRLGKYNKAIEPLVGQSGKDAVADYYLGRIFLYGYGQLKNTNLAIRYFTKSAEKGYLPSILVMAKYNLFALKNPELAVKWFKAAADASDVNAQLFMASAYLYGIGVKQNVDTATKYFIDAARNGNPIAQFALADNFMNSRNASNAKLGLIWLNKAANNGNVKALTKLAEINSNGKLVDKDLDKAKELLNQAIAKNYLPATIIMGDLELAQNNHQKAIEWYNKAAAAHDTQAYLHLAHAYLQDKSPIFDANQGFLWTLKAAQENNTEGKTELANLYLKGIGVPANAELAKQWMDKAAQDTKKKNTIPALALAALWLSNGGTDKLEQTQYQMGGIFSAWQNVQALRDNIYNGAPQMYGPSRKALFKPQFELFQPNDVTITSYYDALNTKHVAYEENQWTYPRYPLNRQIESLERIYSLAVNKLNLPAPFMDASYYDYDDYSNASVMDIWTDGWEKVANFNSVFNQLYFRAILGDAQSQFEIGQMFQYGLGVTQNLESAIIFYQNAAEQQHLGAEYNLGILFLQHPQDAKSYQQALNWLTDSAFKGNRKAQYVLARVLREGKKDAQGKDYIQPNPEQATSMLYLAAANNYGPAQFDLAELLAESNDSALSVEVKKHRILTIRQLYQGAAHNGVAQAMLPLAFYNAMDNTNKERQDAAFKVAEQQAIAGDDRAALLLGLLYDHGIGVTADPSKAIFWYQHAGENVVSDFILGTYMAEGKNISEDKEKAKQLLTRSAEGAFSYGNFNLAVMQQQEHTEFLPNLVKSYQSGNSHAGIVLADYYISANTDADKMNQAKEIFVGLAQKGDQFAQLKLAYMLDKGLGGTKDLNAALGWYTQSAEQGNPMAQYLLGQFYQIGALNGPDYAEAKQWYAKAAQHIPVAAVALGFVYETVDDNYSQALKSYQQAASSGDVKGIYDLGLMYLYGKGIPVDFAKAKELLTDAANKGSSAAMNQLGMMSFLGMGQDRNDSQAWDWYKKAADLGNVNAYYELGLFSEKGFAASQDLKEAFKYYQMAADKGNVQGMLALARMYQFGIGVEKDAKRSLEIYQKLAQMQNAFAQYQLGTFYLEGTAVERSADKGKQWLRQASDNGNAQAKKALQRLDAQTNASGSVSFVEPVDSNES